MLAWETRHFPYREVGDVNSSYVMGGKIKRDNTCHVLGQGEHLTPSFINIIFKVQIEKCYFPHQKQRLALIKIHTPSFCQCDQDLALSNLLSPATIPLTHHLSLPASKALCPFYQHKLLSSSEHPHMLFPLPGMPSSPKDFLPAHSGLSSKATYLFTECQLDGAWYIVSTYLIFFMNELLFLWNWYFNITR